MKFKIELDGQDLLRKRLRRVDRSLKGKALLEAAKAGATVVRDRAREKAPKGASGDLARGIIFATSVRSRDYMEVSVAHRRTSAFYGAFLEEGVQPHTRKAGKRIHGKNYTGRRGGDTRPTYTHPGFPPQPHLRPAFDEETEAATRAALDELRAVVIRSTAT